MKFKVFEAIARHLFRWAAGTQKHCLVVDVLWTHGGMHAVCVPDGDEGLLITCLIAPGVVPPRRGDRGVVTFRGDRWHYSKEISNPNIEIRNERPLSDLGFRISDFPDEGGES